MTEHYVPLYERIKNKADARLPAGATKIRSLKEVEIEHVMDALRNHKWNRSKAAIAIGIAPHTMQMKIKEYRKRGVVIPDNPEYPNGVHINAEE